MNPHEETYSPVKEAEKYLAKVEKLYRDKPTPMNEILLKAAREYLAETIQANPEE